MISTKIKCRIEDANGISNLLRDVAYSYLPTIGEHCYFTIVEYHDSEYTGTEIYHLIRVHHPCEIEGIYNRSTVEKPLSPSEMASYMHPYNDHQRIALEQSLADQ